MVRHAWPLLVAGILLSAAPAALAEGLTSSNGFLPSAAPVFGTFSNVSVTDAFASAEEAAELVVAVVPPQPKVEPQPDLFDRHTLVKNRPALAVVDVQEPFRHSRLALPLIVGPLSDFGGSADVAPMRTADPAVEMVGVGQASRLWASVRAR